MLVLVELLKAKAMALVGLGVKLVKGVVMAVKALTVSFVVAVKDVVVGAVRVFVEELKK